jgi:ribonuclease D
MIVICKDEKTNKYLEKYIEDFINYNGIKIIGIDFEFNRIKNKREIALCQINFEKDNKKSDIFLFYPPNINKNIFIKLLTDINIIKILHGGESLDIPYLFDNILFNNDRKKFCHNLFDTRYMCEYNNIKNNNNSRCRIYDLLLNMKVITQQKYDELMKNDKLIGNIWEVNINVKNMSKKVIKYCAYDVIYLPDLYRKFPKDEIYQNILPDLSCVAFNLRYNSKLNEFSEELTKYNNHKYNDYNYNELFIMVLEYLKLEYIYIDVLYNINYFKKIIELIIKNIVYNNIDKNIKLFDFYFESDNLYLKIKKSINNII